MSRTIVSLSVVIAVVASATAFYFFQENRDLRAQLAATPTPEAPREIVRTVVVPASPVTEPAAVAEATVTAELVEPAREGRGEGLEGGRGRGVETFARMLADPDARGTMLARMKMGIDRTFGDLFVKLGLDEVQAETLRTLLAERQMARMDSGLLARMSDDEAGREEARALREARNQSIDAGIAAILGPDGGAVLEDYQRSSSQRNAVKDIDRRASYQGAPLSQAQSDQLVSIMRTAEAEVPVQPSRQRGPLTSESVSSVLSQKSAQNSAIIAQARGILTKPQLEALADKQIEEIEMLQQQLNFQLRNPDISGRGMDFRGPSGPGFGGPPSGGRRGGGGGGG